MATTTTTDGVSLHYETAGDGPTVAFVGEAGYGAWQWGWQHRRVSGPYQSLVWDLRGTGRSGTPAGPYDVDRLAADLEAVLSDAGIRRVHLVGTGLGGMVTLRYARRYDRVATMTLFGTAPSGQQVRESRLRGLHASGDDHDALVASLEDAFTGSFLETADDIVADICEWRASEDADGTGFEAQVTATLSFESGPLYELTLPALVCHGVDDPVVSVEAGRHLADDLPRGTFGAVEGRHLCFVEHSRAVTDRLLAFLDEHAGTESAGN